MRTKHLILLGLAFIALALVLVVGDGFAGQAKPVALQATATPTAKPTVVPTTPPPPEVPYLSEWEKSPHNDYLGEPFTHWNEDDPAEVPVNCARCHTTQGYQDYLGADGSAVNKVDKAVKAPAGSIQCVACHNSATVVLDTVQFPYTYTPEGATAPVNATVTGLGPEARCMVCHQGRASKASVDTAIETFKLTDDLDKVAEKQGDQTLGFVNVHYFPAAATLYGTVVKGGYEYDGKTYDAKNDHVAGYNTCIGCHNQHTLQVRVDQCKTCHTNVTKVEDLKNVRMAGSALDYDGDGNVKEGIAAEIDGLREALYKNIQAYAKEVAKVPIIYTPDANPYFFIDTNADGKVSEDETKSANRYNAWTGRLLKAAYNYQLSVKDPGNFAHGGKYIIELLYDSTEDLNSKVTTKLDMAKMNRVDSGHFAGSEEPFRHWDAEGEVPGSCAKCHSAVGLPMFLEEAAAQSDGVSGVVVASPTANGLNCATCHDDLAKFTRRPVTKVKFPSGKVVTFDEKGADANLCIECHQGRESTVSVDAAITRSGATDDQVSDKLSFRNPHYFAAGATLFGNDAMGAYQYQGQAYNGRFLHDGKNNTCVMCHDVHALTVKTQLCSGCHKGVATVEDLQKIRMATKDDFDGDGNATEGIGEEVTGMEAALLKAIQGYAGTKEGTKKIAYDGAAYPYFFEDANGNGKVDEGEKPYATWTPRLLRAAYNYQWVQKDPGAFTHNGKYIAQILYDSLKDLGADVTKMTRPTAPTTTQ